MIRKYTAALVQMDTQNNKKENLDFAAACVAEAAGRGAKLVCFPEVMNLIGRNTGEGGGKEICAGVFDGAADGGSQGVWRVYSCGERDGGDSRGEAVL